MESDFCNNAFQTHKKKLYTALLAVYLKPYHQEGG